MKLTLILGSLAAQTSALTARGSPPVVKSFTVLGNVTDPSLNRDSCSSAQFGDKVFWTCRDTQVLLENGNHFGLWANSAGWSERGFDGRPAVQQGGPIGVASTGSNTILPLKGPGPSLPLFYPLGPDMCPDAGVCNDGSR